MNYKNFILTEANRRDLIDKGKRGDNYVPSNQAKGRNRFERRRHSKIVNVVNSINQIDFNAFFKADMLIVGIKVVGETDDYITKFKFEGVLKEIENEVKHNDNKLEFKSILSSLIRVFNSRDVYISCSCPDFRYRFSFVATKNNYNSGPPEMRPSDITNPNDTKGSGCKHTLLVLANMDWLMKVASVINNYIKYAKASMQRLYADYIFPKIYGVAYNKAVQLNLFDSDDFDDSPYTLADANRIGRTSGQFKSGNQYRFQKKEEPIEDETNPLGLKFRKQETETHEEESPTIDKNEQ